METTPKKISMDENTFLTKVKSTVYDILEQNKNTKLSMKLCCKMVRTDTSTGEDNDTDAVFWSDTHENYPATA
jgi:hypothetical protein